MPEHMLSDSTVLRERAVDSTIHRAEIIQRIKDSESISNQYLVKVGDGEREEVMSYNATVDHLNKQIEKKEDDPDSVFTFKSISSHREVNNQYENLVEWEIGDNIETY